MFRSAARGVLVLLLWLGIPLGALAQEEERVDITPRIKEIRELFAKLQEASKGPTSIDRKRKAEPAQWYRLRAWEMTVKPDARLRKLVVNSRDRSGELERSFYMQGNLLFFAHYVRTSPGSARERKRDEERMYFGNTGVPIRWQHNKDIQPMDGNAYRWGEQARSDAKVARALADDKASTARFEPITCVVGTTECTGEHGGRYCTTDNSLFPPRAFPSRRISARSNPGSRARTWSARSFKKA